MIGFITSSEYFLTIFCYILGSGLLGHVPERGDNGAESIAADDNHHEPGGVQAEHSADDYDSNDECDGDDDDDDDDDGDGDDDDDDDDNYDDNQPDADHDATHQVSRSPRHSPLPGDLQGQLRMMKIAMMIIQLSGDYIYLVIIFIW